MNKKYFVSAVFAAFLAASCHQGPSRNPNGIYMATANMENVVDFSQKIKLPSPQNVDIGGVGFTGFKVLDSAIVVSAKGQSGVLRFYRKNDMVALGSFLNIGKSKEEVAYSPTLSNFSSFYRENDSLYADVFDFVKRRLLTFNVDECLKDKRTVLKSEYKEIASPTFTIVRLPDGKYFIKQLEDHETRQIRSIRDLKTGDVTITPIMKRLNEASVKKSEDINVLSTITRVGKDGRIFEMPVGLNYLNIYTPDGTFEKTVCIGENADDIDDVLNTSRWKRKYTFSDIRVFDKFFGVVKIDEEEAAYQTKRTKMPSILLFNLDGKPLAQIDMKRQITSFDVDVQKGILYTFDSQTEEFLKYDISKWLKNL